MKKFLLCLSLLIFLTGCYEASDIEKEVNDAISELANNKSNRNDNHVKRYYKYYLPPDVAAIGSEDTYNIFGTEATTFVMNLDVGRVIDDKYYHTNDYDNDSIYLNNYLVYELNGHILSSDFDINVYQHDDLYLLELCMNDVIFSACVRLNFVKETLRKMLIIGDSVNIDEMAIIDELSNKDVIEYRKEKIDLFQIIIPKDGRLEELINPKFNINIEKNDEIVNPDEQSDVEIDEEQ